MNLITITYTGPDAPGGVPRWVRDFNRCFPETINYCWNDCPLSTHEQHASEWDKAFVLNSWLKKFGKINKDDIIIVDGFWGKGLEEFPNVVSVCHGIWSHLIKEEADAGKKPDFPIHHAVQVGYRRGHLSRGGRLVAVSQFIQHQMDLQWGFKSDVINNAIDVDAFTRYEKLAKGKKPLIIHGVNDRGNPVKGWDHIKFLEDSFDADIYSLDEYAAAMQALDKMEALAQADLVVIPSAYEGNSYFALETLACDVPVVAYDVGLFWELSPFNNSKHELGYNVVGSILPRGYYHKEKTLDKVFEVIDQLKHNHKYTPREVAKNYSIQNFEKQWKDYLKKEFDYESPSASR